MTAALGRPFAFAVAAVLALLPTAPTSAAAQEDSASRTALTVYNDGRALVEEHHSLRLEEGIQTTRIRNVPARLDPTSVTLHFPRDPETTRVLEQDFGYDLAGADRLLEEHVGHEIELTTVGGSLVPDRGDELAGRLCPRVASVRGADASARSGEPRQRERP